MRNHTSLIGAVLLMLAPVVAAQTQNSTSNFEYDATGNLKKVVDPLTNVTQFSYDNLNRRASETSVGYFLSVLMPSAPFKQSVRGFPRAAIG